MLEIPQEIKKTLQNIGLDTAEQQVVFYLFKQGLSAIADIASGVKLPRSTIHLAVENLLERKVLGVTILGKRRMLYIEKPEKLKKFVEYEQAEAQKKMTELESLLPELRTFFALRGNAEKIDVEFLEGEDGFIETFFRSLDQEKGGEVLRISGDTETFTVARERLKGYGVARRKKNITARHIITDSPMAEDEIIESRIKSRETRVIAKSILNPNLHMSIWKNHVTFTIWDEGLHSIIITNKSIYDFMKMMFEIAWSGASTK
jgi:predicted transcriptional regulator